ncbi:MAG: hypothetical protein HMLKMBBP_02106 [Planctomycetes bacterium]|nr:hypothetical protein [Planctomycetota bacterium]
MSSFRTDPGGEIRASELEPLRPVLARWARMVAEYPALHDREDTLAWQQERSLVGTVATAAWLAGGVAVEEWAIRKPGGRRRGRADLYVGIGSSDYVLELKHDWISVRPGEERLGTVLTSMLDAAERQVADYPDGHGLRIAAAFGAPYSRRREETECVRESALSAATRLLDSGAAQFAVWGEAPPMRWPPQGPRGAWHAGVLLLGRLLATGR